jgi:hypothetical protein
LRVAAMFVNVFRRQKRHTRSVNPMPLSFAFKISFV